jgi:hypothetical protein
VVSLQASLMRAAGEFGDVERFAPLKDRMLATAASLDYVLMLTTGSAGLRVRELDAERAIRDGMARAVDDLIAGATAIARSGVPAARRFAHDASKPLRAALRSEQLENDERTFAVIALANA